ncbi:MAG: alpha-amylase family glycosyl hydrolase [Flavobacteriales bacterium]
MNTKYVLSMAAFQAVLLSFVACGESDSVQQGTSPAQAIHSPGGTGDALVHPAWSKNATIYEVNVRQHTAEGTFAAFERDLPRLKELGVDILWLMPIHPIGDENRKGGENANNFIAKPGSTSLGSPYSVRDYFAVNPDYGTLDDLKSLVAAAHALDMKLILDWVANHTAFDSDWTRDHREFFLLDSAGKLQPPLGTDWWDVTQLDWENGQSNGLYDAMDEALDYWVREADIDGYRCDVAMKVPTAFWEQARRSLEAIKPDVFMLAEAEEPDHHNRAFDMSYAWHLHHLYNQVSTGAFPLDSLREYLAHELGRFGADAYRMSFVTNHDENSWNGTIAERMGANGDAMAVLAGTLMGMPLIYSGQEAGLSKRLRFFEKDTVEWGDYNRTDFYKSINRLNHDQPALWNGGFGAFPVEISTNHPDKIFAFHRTLETPANQIVVAINLSDVPLMVTLPLDEDDHQLELAPVGAESGLQPSANPLEIPAHGYAVWSQKAEL